DSWHEPRDGGARLHKWIDIFATRGTEVVAVVDGIISYIGDQPKGGHCLWLTTENGASFYYAHLDRWAAGLYEGMEVQAGDLLGYVGNTGNAKYTPSHLHFGVDQNDEMVNPYPLLTRATPIQHARVHVSLTGGPVTTALSNFGGCGGASTGSVSRKRLTRTTSSTRPSSCMARRRNHVRSPRFEPRAMRIDQSGSSFTTRYSSMSIVSASSFTSSPARGKYCFSCSPAAVSASTIPSVNSPLAKRMVSFAAISSQKPAGTFSSMPRSPRMTKRCSSVAMKRRTPVRRAVLVIPSRSKVRSATVRMSPP